MPLDGNQLRYGWVQCIGGERDAAGDRREEGSDTVWWRSVVWGAGDRRGVGLGGGGGRRGGRGVERSEGFGFGMNALSGRLNWDVFLDAFFRVAAELRRTNADFLVTHHRDSL